MASVRASLDLLLLRVSRCWRPFLEDTQWWLCGANKADYHLDHVGPVVTLRLTGGKILLLPQEGDICPECGLPLSAACGIEVGRSLPAWHQVLFSS